MWSTWGRQQQLWTQKTQNLRWGSKEKVQRKLLYHNTLWITKISARIIHCLTNRKNTISPFAILKIVVLYPLHYPWPLTFYTGCMCPGTQVSVYYTQILRGARTWTQFWALLVVPKQSVTRVFVFGPRGPRVSVSGWYTNTYLTTTLYLGADGWFSANKQTERCSDQNINTKPCRNTF